MRDPPAEGAVRPGTVSAYFSSLGGWLLRGLCLCYTPLCSETCQNEYELKITSRHPGSDLSSLCLPPLPQPSSLSSHQCRCGEYFQGIANSWFLPSSLLLPPPTPLPPPDYTIPCACGSFPNPISSRFPLSLLVFLFTREKAI